LQIKTKIVSSHTADSESVKQEVNGTVILPPLVFPDKIITRNFSKTFKEIYFEVSNFRRKERRKERNARNKFKPAVTAAWRNRRCPNLNIHSPFLGRKTLFFDLKNKKCKFFKANNNDSAFIL
jgi:hypothetical protein